jgi:hypothetical protein
MSFAGDISKFTAKAEKRFKAVHGQSVQDLGEHANKPVSKSGRMRVDTGFLRASQVAGLNEMPSGPTKNEGGRQYSDNDRLGMSPAVAALRWKPGDTLYIAYSAEYARWREYQDGFVRGAAEKWPQIVKDAVRKVK